MAFGEVSVVYLLETLVGLEHIALSRVLRKTGKKISGPVYVPYLLND